MFAAMVLVLGCGGNPEVEDTSPVTVSTTEPEPTLALTLETIGDPMWSLHDFVLFTASLLEESDQCLLLGPHVEDGYAWLPGDPHDPPYTSELTLAVDRCGYRMDVASFTEAEFQAGNGVFLGFVAVAKSGSVPGSSPDFSSGDVIYADRFPFVVDGNVRREQIITDGDHDAQISGPNELGLFVNGLSHVPVLMKTGLDRMPAGATSPGDYTWEVLILDAFQGGSGYSLTIPFEIRE